MFQQNNSIFLSFSYTGLSSGALKRSKDVQRDDANSFDENLVVIYNRVPKTGSTSFINLAYDLCKKNHFYVLHINITANMHILSLSNQVNWMNESIETTYFHFAESFCRRCNLFATSQRGKIWNRRCTMDTCPIWISQSELNISHTKDVAAFATVTWNDCLLQIFDATETTLHKSHTETTGSTCFVLLFPAIRRQLSSEFSAPQSWR